MAEESSAITRGPAPGDFDPLDKHNWHSRLFVVLTAVLLTLAVVTLVFPSVFDYLVQLRAEGDLGRYAGLVVLTIMLYCLYALRMQAQLGGLRRRMVEEKRGLRNLEKLVGQFRRVMHVASTFQPGQRLEETLRVLVGAAQESARARAVSVMLRNDDQFGPLISAGEALLTETQARAVAERLKESSEPLEAGGPGPLAALLGGVPPGLGALVAVPLRNSRGPLGVVMAEFSHALSAGEQQANTSAELDQLRIFAENAVIAMENDTQLRRIERMAITDELTGLFNRRYFNQELEREILRTKRMARPFSLVLFDIDHFKQINDTYGHDAGDEALRRVARALDSMTRKSNLLARFGGEEFATILLETGPEGALIAADRLREVVEKIEGLPRITISAGVALYPQHAHDPAGLLKSADVALYTAKRAGRNQVCLAQAALRAST